MSDFNEKKQEVEDKIQEIQDKLNVNKTELQTLYAKKAETVTSFLGKAKLKYNKFTDFLDEKLFKNSSKSSIVVVGMIAIFLVWIL